MDAPPPSGLTRQDVSAEACIVPEDVGQGILRARVYAGYSGWGPGQLEAEMREGSWILDPAQRDDVFTGAPDRLWSRVLQRKGPEYRQMSRIPFDPTMN